MLGPPRPPKDRNQQARQRSGEDTERYVAALHEVLVWRRIARLRKLPTEWKPIRPGPQPGSVIAVPAKKSDVDYRGNLLDGSGRAVYVEAKRLREHRLNFGSRLPEQQRVALNDAIADNCIAVLLVIYGEVLEAATVHAIGWRYVQVLIDGGAKSIGPEHLEPHIVPRGTPYLARFVRGREVTP